VLRAAPAGGSCAARGRLFHVHAVAAVSPNQSLQPTRLLARFSKTELVRSVADQLTFGAMTPRAQRWMLRLLSIPVHLYLPVFCALPGGVILRENDGDSMPWFTALGAAFGLALSVVLSRWTIFASKTYSLLNSYKILGATVMFEAVVFTTLLIWPSS
jgi:hypothetical protein